VCVPSLIIQHAKPMHRIILPSVFWPTLPYFFTLSHKRHGFREKAIEQKYVFCLFLQLLSETFMSLKNSAW